MEQQFQNEQVSAKEAKRLNLAVLILINVIVATVVSVVVVYFMQADLRGEIDEINEKAQYIRVGK